MKDKKLLMVGTAMVTLSGLVAASRVQGATQAVGMDAQIVQAITLAVAQTLNFGTLIPAGGGTRVVSVAGAPTDTGVTSLGAPQAGQVTVTGDPGRAIAVSSIANDTVTHTVTPANTMSVTGFQVAFGDAAPAATGTQITNGAGVVIPVDGDGIVFIGATLNVGAAQVDGTYTGSFDVVVNY